MTKTDQRKTKAELIAELEAVRAHLAGLCDACNVGESDERYRRLVQFLPDAVRVSCNGTIVYVNDAAVTLFRADGPDDLIGRNTEEFVLPEEQEAVEARRRALYAQNVLPTTEQRRFALNGGIVHVELKSMVISWQGKPATLTVMRDISSRIRNRAALAESEQRLAAVAENIPGVTFQCVLHGNGRFSYPYISPSVQSLFGVEAGEIMRNGLALQRCIHPDDRKGVRDAFRRSVGNLAPFEREMRIVAPKGEVRWVRGIARPRRRADGKYVWEGLFLDVTSHRRIEVALRQAKEMAEFANRTKTEFLANMSHELRTPLNAILGFSEVIERELLGPVEVPQYREYAGDIRESGTHLLDLINDILEFAKIEAGRLELSEDDVDVEQVIRSSVRVLKRRADSGKLNLAVRVAKKLPHLRGDERRIKQIMLNLLSNASKFTPDGGTVSVTADVDTASALRIRIADTGIGIAEKDMGKVLEPFGQVRGPVKGFSEGTGLGLPLTKSLVERHGGKLSLKSRVGRGTTITVRFPALRLVA